MLLSAQLACFAVVETLLSLQLIKVPTTRVFTILQFHFRTWCFLKMRNRQIRAPNIAKKIAKRSKSDNFFVKNCKAKRKFYSFCEKLRNCEFFQNWEKNAKSNSVLYFNLFCFNWNSLNIKKQDQTEKIKSFKTHYLNSVHDI